MVAVAAGAVQAAAGDTMPPMGSVGVRKTANLRQVALNSKHHAHITHDPTPTNTRTFLYSRSFFKQRIYEPV